jgi:ubiquinone/menaquinone biosynthesis C-methylase UbiE
MELKIFNKTAFIPLNGLNVSRRMEFALLSRYLDLKGSEKLLDVACGDGYWTSILARQARSVVGFDFNRQRLLQARHRSGDIIQGLIGCDAHILPFRREAFDAVVGICVLEHFRDDLKALQEMRRVLKTGGKLAMTVDSFSVPGITAQEKVRHAKAFSVAHWYRIEDLSLTLEKAGFIVTEWTYMLKSPLSIAFYRANLKNSKLAYLLFPLAYPASLLGEALSRNNQYGYKLAFNAVAV